MSLEKIKKNIAKIHDPITKNAPHSSIYSLLCVTKYATIENIKYLYQAGERNFGENKIQDTEKKQAIITNEDINWHFIGHLQRNKVKKALQLYTCIQSVDSLKLLKKIDEEAAKLSKVQSIYIQINLTGETHKYGFTLDEFNESSDAFLSFKSCKIKGIMSMGPNTSNIVDIRNVFRESAKCHSLLQEKMNSSLVLSMGMSNDYELAIAEGSNMIRIGSKLYK